MCSLGKSLKLNALLFRDSVAKEVKKVRSDMSKTKSDAFTQQSTDRITELEAKYEKIDVFALQQKRLCGYLDIILCAMTSYVPMEEEDLAQIEQVAKETGILWRTLKMGARKPKLHLIEAHAATCIRQIGAMGFISEEKTESLHASIKRLHALFGSIRSIERQEALVLQRQNQKSARVDKSIEQMVDETSRKKQKMIIGATNLSAAGRAKYISKQMKKETTEDWATTSVNLSNTGTQELPEFIQSIE